VPLLARAPMKSWHKAESFGSAIVWAGLSGIGRHAWRLGVMPALDPGGDVEAPRFRLSTQRGAAFSGGAAGAGFTTP
jgi:hypothetical protein